MQDKDQYINAPSISMDWPYGAGALLPTVGNLLKWNTALHDGKILKKETLEKAFIKGDDGKYSKIILY